MRVELRCEKIWLSTKAVDFRKAVNGLCALVVEELNDNPGEGLYVFYNKARNRLKILGWHGNGFVLVHKRLEKGKFTIDCSQDKLTLNQEQLSWLLAGLDWQLLGGWDKADFKDYF